MNITFDDDLEINSGELPNFGAPPVVEVTFGIQFEELQNYNSLKLASFREIVKDHFPIVEEHPPLLPAFETFGVSDNQISQPKFEIMQTPVLSRFFLISNDSRSLLQLQSDRFHFNWRKVSESDTYPRYETLKEPFLKLFGEFQKWSTDMGLGEIKPTQSEVVYVNRIPLNFGTGKPCGLSQIFEWFDGLKGTTENGSFKFRRKLNDETNKPAGRFFFELDYGTGPSGEREAILKLTVRGRPNVAETASYLDFIDQGRSIIVREFARVTSKTAHKFWEKR